MKKIFVVALLLLLVLVAAYFFLKPESRKEVPAETPVPTETIDPGVPTATITPGITGIEPTQNKIMVDMLIKGGLVCPANECIVDRVQGNFAKGLMPMGYWIAIKDKNVWKPVVMGNGIPACSEVEVYSIPRDIYGNCIDASGELKFK